jgi:hypothetical protein
MINFYLEKVNKLAKLKFYILYNKVLKRKEIRTSFKPLITIRQRMRSVKNPIDQRQQKGVYKVSCSCGKSYIGETGRSFQIRIKEHEGDIKNAECIHTSALA